MINLHTNLARRASGLVAASLLLTVSFTAHAAVVVDFETDGQGNTLSPGDILTNTTIFNPGSSTEGVTFSVFNQGNAGNSNNGANPGAGISTGIGDIFDIANLNAGGNRDLILFDADCNPSCTGQDPDLELPGEGNILIISEDNNSSDPDDSRFGGAVLVDFLPPVVNLNNLVIDFSDNNNQAPGDSFALAIFQGEVVGLFDFVAGLGDNNLQTANFGDIEVDQLLISIDSSGGIVSLEFTPVPVPAAVYLFATGLGMLGFAKRKKC